MKTKNEISVPSKGINQDIDPLSHNQGSYRYALNAVNKSRSGDARMLTSENANILCVELLLDYLIIGSSYMNNGDIAFWGVRLTGETDKDVIGILHDNCEYTIEAKGNFGFSKGHQIDSIFRVRNGCDRIVYFTDNKNNVRYYNFDKKYLFLDESGVVNPEKLDLIKDYKSIPYIESVKVNNGGSIPNGALKIGIRYITEDGIHTNVVNLSNQINMYYPSTGGAYDLIYGSHNGFVGRNYEEGILDTPKHSGKNLTINVENLDDDFKYYQLVFYLKTTDEGVVNRSLISPKIGINQTTYTFFGNEPETTEIDPNELLIGRLDLYRAEHIDQIENRLILANVKGKELDFCGMQKYASKINVTYHIKQVPADELVPGNVKHPTTPFDCMTFMADEVYALGIVYVYPDGYETMAFHIPGRAPTDNDMSIIQFWDQNLNYLIHHTEAAAYNALPDNEKLRRWQIYNTASNDNLLGYYETKNTIYEPKRKCTGLEYWGRDKEHNELLNNPVRHHKMPSRANVSLVSEKGDTLSNERLVFTVKFRLDPANQWPTDQGQDGEGLTCTGYFEYPQNGFLIQTPFSFRTDFHTEDVIVAFPLDIADLVIVFDDPAFDGIFNITKSIESKVFNTTSDGQYINLIGLDFDNIEYPEGAIGHYIVSGIRDEFNRTIWDKGIANELRENNDYITHSWFQNRMDLDTGVSRSNDMFYCMYPKALFYDMPGAISHVHVEGLYSEVDGFPTYHVTDVKQDVMDGTSSSGLLFGVIDVDDDGMDWILGFKWTDYIYSNQVPNTFNFKAVSNVRLRPGESINNYKDGKTLYNTTLDNSIQIIKSENFFLGDNHKIKYVSLKVANEVYPDPFRIKYRKISNKVLTGKATLFGGDAYISKVSFSASTYYETDVASRWWETVANLFAIIVVTIISGLTLGPLAAGIAIAMGIASVAAEIVTQFMKDVDDKELKKLIHDNRIRAAISDRGKKDDLFRYKGSHISGIFIESDIPIGLRAKSAKGCDSFYSYGYSDIDKLNTYFTRKYIKPSKARENKSTLSPIPCPEVFLISKDYEITSLVGTYFALPFEFDCCSQCTESFPNRVHSSLQSFQEGVTDFYSSFKPNDYIDIDSSFGKITDLFVLGNNLHVHTERALFKLPHNLQERVTDELVTYIGTGSFFSLPPRKVIDDDLGSGGSIHKWATVKHNGVVYFISYHDRKVYMYNARGANPISSQGLDKFFEENTVLLANERYRESYDHDFPLINNHANPEGIGYHAMIDHVNERYILTKRDYTIGDDFFTNDIKECNGSWIFFNNYADIIEQHKIAGWHYMGLDDCKLLFEKEVIEIVQVPVLDVMDIHILNDYSGSYTHNDIDDLNQNVLAWANTKGIPPSRVFFHEELNDVGGDSEKERWLKNVNLIKKSYGNNDEWKGRNILMAVFINEAQPLYHNQSINSISKGSYYNTDRPNFLDFNSNLNWFKTIFYPIIKSGHASGQQFLFSLMAQIQGVNLSVAQTDALYTRNPNVPLANWNTFLANMANNPYDGQGLESVDINLKENSITIPSEAQLLTDFDTYVSNDVIEHKNIIIERKVVEGIKKEVKDYITCDNSWTLSYSMDRDWGWISWHSYIPLYYLNNKKNFFSMPSAGKVFIHNVLGSYIKFYDVQSSFELEFVMKGPELQQFISQSLTFDTDAEKYDFDRKRFVDKRFVTFNKFYAYNSRQFSGLLSLVNKDKGSPFLHQTVTDSVSSIEIDRNERYWHLNDYRDLIVDYDIPFFQDVCNGDSLYLYKGDKSIVPESFSFDKPWNEQELLRDKFVIFRLIFDNTDDVRLTIKSFFHKKQNSER